MIGYDDAVKIWCDVAVSA